MPEGEGEATKPELSDDHEENEKRREEKDKKEKERMKQQEQIAAPCAARRGTLPRARALRLWRRTKRALAGWGRLEPGWTRPPMPWFFAALVAATLTDTGEQVAGLQYAVWFPIRCHEGGPLACSLGDAGRLRA